LGCDSPSEQSIGGQVYFLSTTLCMSPLIEVKVTWKQVRPALSTTERSKVIYTDCSHPMGSVVPPAFSLRRSPPAIGGKRASSSPSFKGCFGGLCSPFTIFRSGIFSGRLSRPTASPTVAPAGSSTSCSSGPNFLSVAKSLILTFTASLYQTWRLRQSYYILLQPVSSSVALTSLDAGSSPA
jgi:hypothetical protein